MRSHLRQEGTRRPAEDFGRFSVGRGQEGWKGEALTKTKGACVREEEIASGEEEGEEREVREPNREE